MPAAWILRSNVEGSNLGPPIFAYPADVWTVDWSCLSGNAFEIEASNQDWPMHCRCWTGQLALQLCNAARRKAELPGPSKAHLNFRKSKAITNAPCSRKFVFTLATGGAPGRTLQACIQPQCKSEKSLAAGRHSQQSQREQAESPLKQGFDAGSAAINPHHARARPGGEGGFDGSESLLSQQDPEKHEEQDQFDLGARSHRVVGSGSWRGKGTEARHESLSLSVDKKGHAKESSGASGTEGSGSPAKRKAQTRSGVQSASVASLHLVRSKSEKSFGAAGRHNRQSQREQAESPLKQGIDAGSAAINPHHARVRPGGEGGFDGSESLLSQQDPEKHEEQDEFDLGARSHTVVGSGSWRGKGTEARHESLSLSVDKKGHAKESSVASGAEGSGSPAKTKAQTRSGVQSASVASLHLVRSKSEKSFGAAGRHNRQSQREQAESPLKQGFDAGSAAINPHHARVRPGGEGGFDGSESLPSQQDPEKHEEQDQFDLGARSHRVVGSGSWRGKGTEARHESLSLSVDKKGHAKESSVASGADGSGSPAKRKAQTRSGVQSASVASLHLVRSKSEKSFGAAGRHNRQSQREQAESPLKQGIDAGSAAINPHHARVRPGGEGGFDGSESLLSQQDPEKHEEQDHFDLGARSHRVVGSGSQYRSFAVEKGGYSGEGGKRGKDMEEVSSPTILKDSQRQSQVSMRLVKTCSRCEGAATGCECTCDAAGRHVRVASGVGLPECDTL